MRALLAAILLFSGSAVAHQQKEAITRVLFNQRTGNIEVMHRFLLHDAEHAVQQIIGKHVDMLQSPDAQNKFAVYVHQRFQMLDQSGRELVLSPVGVELEGRYLWVYAETPINDDITAVTITHSALRDIWHDQVNLINIEKAGELVTLVFQGNVQQLSVDIPMQ